MAVDPTIQQKADDIRMKIYGEQVRESLASGLEVMSEDVVNIENRQDIVESQFQDVIENTTGKDVVSAPEIIAARNGEANLKTRLDKENQEVTAQLAQNTEQLKKRVEYTDLTPVVGYDFAPDFSYNLLLRNYDHDYYMNYIENLNTDDVKNIVLGRRSQSSSDGLTITNPYATDQEVKDYINAIKARGITLKAFRTYINTITNTNYKTNFIQSYVDLCKSDIDLCVEMGIENYVFANEMPYYSWYEEYHSYFTEVINYAHTNNIKVVASLSFDELNGIEPVYLSEVDYIGINVYPSISDRGTETTLDYATDNLAIAGESILKTLFRIYKKYNIPFWITECGCTKHEFALQKPSNRTQDGSGTYPEMQYIYLSAILKLVGSVKFNGVNPIKNFCYFSLLDYNDVYTILDNEYALEVVKSTYKKNKNLSRNNHVDTPNYTLVLDDDVKLIDKNKSNQVFDTLYSDNGSVALNKSFPRQMINGFLFGKSTFSGSSITPISDIRVTSGNTNFASTNSIINNGNYIIVNDSSFISNVNEIAFNSYENILFEIDGLDAGTNYVYKVKYTILDDSPFNDSGISAVLYNSTNSVALTPEYQGVGGYNELSLEFTATETLHYVRLNINRNLETKQIYFYDLKCFDSGSDLESYSNLDLTNVELHDFDFVDLKNKIKYTNSYPAIINGDNTFTIDTREESTVTFYTTLPFSPKVNVSSGNYYADCRVNDSKVWELSRSDTKSNNTVYVREYGGCRVYFTVKYSTINGGFGSSDSDLLSLFSTYISNNTCDIVVKKATPTQTELTYPDVYVDGKAGNNIKTNARLLLMMSN